MNTTHPLPFASEVSPEERADAQEVIAALAGGRPVDPDVVRRVHARADQIRQRILATHGVQDIGVDLIRELRGELPTA